jgi:microcystin degradation protein MlrC
MPIAVSLDLHANITELMFSNASVIDCYRTYPHIDMRETGRRTAMHLEYLIENNSACYPFKTMRRASYLIPHNWGSTLIDPCKMLYQCVANIAEKRSQVVTFASGFPHADIAQAGPVILVYGQDEQLVNQTADGVQALVEAAKPKFKGEIYTLREAIVVAQDHVDHGTTPVIIADTQDNPGGGGPGDTVGLLRALIDTQRKDAVVAMILDPQVAKLAHAAGVGQSIRAALGEQSKMAGHQPLEGEYLVLALGDGNFTATGPMYGGTHMQLGLMARLEIKGVQVLVTSKSVQVADQSIFRHLGVEPAEQSIISVKSSVHFRNDFQEIAGAILLVAAPGPVAADLKQLDYQNVPQSMIL